MRRLSTFAALVVLGAALIVSTAHAIPKTGIAAIDPNGNFIDLKADASGNVLMIQRNRPVDDNTIQYLFTGQTIAPGASALSQFINTSEFKGGMLQLAWSDSLGTAASSDSVAFEVYLMGHVSTTNDGRDFYIDTDNTTAALDGWFVASPNNPWIAASGASTLIKSSTIVYTKLAASGGSAFAPIMYQVSIPLVNKQGAPLLDYITGIQVVNRSGTMKGTATGVGTEILHNLSAGLVLKVN